MGITSTGFATSKGFAASEGSVRTVDALPKPSRSAAIRRASSVMACMSSRLTSPPFTASPICAAVRLNSSWIFSSFEPIYLRDQPCPYFFNGAVESVQFGGLLLKTAGGLGNLRGPDAPPRGSQGREWRPPVCGSDPGFRIGRQPTGRRSQHDDTLVDVFALGLDVLVFLEIKLKLLQFACPPRGIVLQSRGLVDQSLGNSARALVFEIWSCRCRRRSPRDGRHWAAGLRVYVGPQNEGLCFGTRRLGNLTDWRTGGESRYLLRRRRDAHSRSRRCGWGAPLLRQNEPQCRNADHQFSDQYDDQAHLITLLSKRTGGYRVDLVHIEVSG